MATRTANGAAIRALRERTGIKQADFAKRVGVNQGTLSNVERGNKNASPYLIHRIAGELGVPIDAITRTASAA